MTWCSSFGSELLFCGEMMNPVALQRRVLKIGGAGRQSSRRSPQLGQM